MKISSILIIIFCSLCAGIALSLFGNFSLENMTIRTIEIFGLILFWTLIPLATIVLYSLSVRQEYKLRATVKSALFSFSMSIFKNSIYLGVLGIKNVGSGDAVNSKDAIEFLLIDPTIWFLVPLEKIWMYIVRLVRLHWIKSIANIDVGILIFIFEVSVLWFFIGLISGLLVNFMKRREEVAPGEDG